MATVKVKDWQGGGDHEHRQSVECYVAQSTESYSDGVAEMAQDQASNVAHTLGRLIEALVDEGILSQEALGYIVGPDAPTVISLRRNTDAKV